MRASQSDFWRMVKDYRSHCIVMLCNLTENGAVSDRVIRGHCDAYWQTVNGSAAAPINYCMNSSISLLASTVSVALVIANEAD